MNSYSGEANPTPETTAALTTAGAPKPSSSSSSSPSSSSRRMPMTTVQETSAANSSPSFSCLNHSSTIMPASCNHPSNSPTRADDTCVIIDTSGYASDCNFSDLLPQHAMKPYRVMATMELIRALGIVATANRTEDGASSSSLLSLSSSSSAAAASAESSAEALSHPSPLKTTMSSNESPQGDLAHGGTPSATTTVTGEVIVPPVTPKSKHCNSSSSSSTGSQRENTTHHKRKRTREAEEEEEPNGENINDDANNHNNNNNNNNNNNRNEVEEQHGPLESHGSTATRKRRQSSSLRRTSPRSCTALASRSDHSRRSRSEKRETDGLRLCCGDGDGSGDGGSTPSVAVPHARPTDPPSTTTTTQEHLATKTATAAGSEADKKKDIKNKNNNKKEEEEEVVVEEEEARSVSAPPPAPNHATRTTHAITTTRRSQNHIPPRCRIIVPPLIPLRELEKAHALTYLGNLGLHNTGSWQWQASTSRAAFSVDCPPVEGIMEHSLATASGTVMGAVLLNARQTRIAMHWGGGMHHAKCGECSGFCYVNDIVLGILELLKAHDRVLYIDLDVHHGDGVDEAFCQSDRVFTLSLHKFGEAFFPGTGHPRDTGYGVGKHHTWNLSLWDGITDFYYVSIFSEALRTICSRFQPNVIVVQCGADSLGGDRLGTFNLSSWGHGACVQQVRNTGLPVLAVGGGGYTIRNVAKLWAYETSILTGTPLPLHTRIPVGQMPLSGWLFEDHPWLLVPSDAGQRVTPGWHSQRGYRAVLDQIYRAGFLIPQRPYHHTTAVAGGSTTSALLSSGGGVTTTTTSATTAITREEDVETEDVGRNRGNKTR